MSMPNPTDAEVEILQVLWGRGPATVRAVHEALDPPRKVQYTTVLKTLQIMHEKGLVKRDTSERAHVYEAAVDAATVERSAVRSLMETVFGGSAQRLVLNALSSEGATQEELDAIKALLEQIEKRS